ncbi:hypothetical protein FHU41_002777 [Psychromicrobium silvestre]|uniref:Uncharacterized protein n=1 Tax=Psychromicrobium silvestre TaxID=1645614 RepID=A0A7Y9LVU0_9MICC|nr:hypothetical protein [Psychromicrobium silvestre]
MDKLSRRFRVTYGEIKQLEQLNRALGWKGVRNGD